jgi:hypothetical protein
MHLSRIPRECSLQVRFGQGFKIFDGTFPVDTARGRPLSNWGDCDDYNGKTADRRSGVERVKRGFSWGFQGIPGRFSVDFSTELFGRRPARDALTGRSDGFTDGTGSNAGPPVAVSIRRITSGKSEILVITFNHAMEPRRAFDSERISHGSDRRRGRHRGAHSHLDHPQFPTSRFPLARLLIMPEFSMMDASRGRCLWPGPGILR